MFTSHCKQSPWWPISKKLADFIVENRTCSMLDDKIWQLYRPTKAADFCMTDNRFLSANFIGRQNWTTLSIVWHPLIGPLRLTALSSCLIMASNSSCPRCHRRRVPLMQVDSDRLFSRTFWQSSAEGIRTLSIPTLNRLSWTHKNNHLPTASYAIQPGNWVGRFYMWLSALIAVTDLSEFIEWTL